MTVTSPTWLAFKRGIGYSLLICPLCYYQDNKLANQSPYPRGQEEILTIMVGGILAVLEHYLATEMMLFAFSSGVHAS